MIIVWRITQQCNLSCPFCAYDRSLPGIRHSANLQGVMQFAKILGEYRKIKGERILLSWMGGEPLLWPPIFEVSSQLHQQFGIEFSTTTNGTRLHLPDIQQKILASFSELTVSIDGPADFHDNLRGAKGNWQRLQEGIRSINTIRNATGKNIKLRANIVLMHDNLPELGELCHTIADWGIDEITFNQLGGRDRPAFYPAHRLSSLDIETLRVLLPLLRHELSRRNVRLCGSEPYLNRIEASAYNQNIAVSDCNPGEQFLFIDEAGNVSPCSFTTAEYAIPLQNITSLNDFFQLPLRFAEARRKSLAASCNDCPSTHFFEKFAA